MVASGLSCGMRDLSLRHEGSVVAALGLSCPAACGILVPWLGIEPASPALEGGFLTTGPQGSPHKIFWIKQRRKSRWSWIWWGIFRYNSKISIREKKRVNLKQRNLTNVTSAMWSRPIPTIKSHVDSMDHDMMWWKRHFIFAIFLPQTQNPSLITRKTSDKFYLRDIVPNT